MRHNFAASEQKMFPGAKSITIPKSIIAQMEAIAHNKEISKVIRYDENGKKIFPERTVYTKLKFRRSERSGLPIGFASVNPVTGRIKGVNADSELRKSICVVDASIAPEIIPGVLYRVAMVPMFEKSGYIVIDAHPHQFKAKIEWHYIPNALYIVDVAFGNRRMRLDFKEGKRESCNTIGGFKQALLKRMDIENIDKVLEEVDEAAHSMLQHYKKDGYYYEDYESKIAKKKKESCYQGARQKMVS